MLVVKEESAAPPSLPLMDTAINGSDHLNHDIANNDNEIAEFSDDEDETSASMCYNLFWIK